ncbi:Firmicute plasmid replication protein (RepL) [Owenweeksia hongkongensis DSM 17368]|uniref:Firmicute plasmid replication protein (RepL) n=1 Tax=Owenweeksia hongkongensis (strain DSM 17368 / CIP 108786 / JCM 12287 / NRRL B-23963 / UST20020801) TaxID=926562 RepID=G8R5P4_OWEHD|nr:replication/maintenance protein RepL [Owenweeksia hongkongensis]AEV34360.1 Firmicute plasmid replication protein (RepL) [Owenweeksia hongkongensis DSM 17368]
MSKARKATQKTRVQVIKNVVKKEDVFAVETRTKTIPKKFVRLFRGASVIFRDLSKGALLMLHELLWEMDPDTNVFSWNDIVKEDMSKNVGMKLATIEGYVENLVKGGAIKNLQRGKYMVNPEIATFSNVSEERRRELIKNFSQLDFREFKKSVKQQLSRQNSIKQKKQRRRKKESSTKVFDPSTFVPTDETVDKNQADSVESVVFAES